MSPLRAIARPPTGWGAAAAAVFAALLLVALLAPAVAGLAPDLGAMRLLTLLVLAPVLEETVFRLGLHETLLRRGWRLWGANATVAAAFGLAHALVQGAPGAWAALPALLIGLSYGRNRRLAPCVILHAAMNLAWLALWPAFA